MGSDEPVQQKIEHAKLALRTNAEQIDFLRPVKDNPITSLSAAFLLGVSSAECTDKGFSSNLLTTLLSISARF
jgi:hypothetical protein